MPVAMYQATLPPRGIIEVRRAADSITRDVSREAELDACRVYFPGTNMVLRLEGEDDDLLGKLSRHSKGGAFLRSLEENAWFPRLATRLSNVFEAGARGGPRTLTGVANFGINAGHQRALLAELPEIAGSLADGPRVEAYTGMGLTVYLEGESQADIDAVLHGDRGSALQRVLHDHTGFSTNAWRSDFALDLEAVRSGLRSTGNFEPGPETKWRVVR